MRISKLILELTKMQAQYGDTMVVIPKLVRPKKRKGDDDMDDIPPFDRIAAMSIADSDRESAEDNCIILSTQRITEHDMDLVNGEPWEEEDPDGQ